MADDNQDDLYSHSSYNVVEHGICRCEKCMSRYSRAPHSDSDASRVGALVCNQERSRMTARLPVDDESWEWFQKTMIERDALAYLTEKRVINWCAGTNKLYTIRTTGDGNCLLHAVSLYMWQQQDELMTLRTFLHHNMSTFSWKDHIRERWQKQREWQNSSIPDGGLHYSNEEWDKEWELLVNAASLMTSTSAFVPFEFLEPIHVFVLANFLCRPIIILGEPYLRSITGDSIEANDFVGIYLPLLFPPRSCYRSPIVLAFLLDHVLPLLGRRPPGSDNSQPFDAVPLVNAALEPLRIHFLLPAEEASAHTILQQYLQLMEIERKSDDGCDSVLAARTTIIDELDNYYVPIHEYIFRYSPLYPACPSRGCEFAASTAFKGFCLPCYLGCVPFRRILILTGLIEPGSEVKKCANVKCKNIPWLPTGGLCRLCMVGLTPKYYDLSFTVCVLHVLSRKRTPMADIFQDGKCSQAHCSEFSEVDFDERKGTKKSLQTEKISCFKKHVYGRVPDFFPLCINHAKCRTREMLNAALVASGVYPNQSSHCATPGCVNRLFGRNSDYCWTCVRRTGQLRPKSKCKTRDCNFPLYLDGLCCLCYWLGQDFDSYAFGSSTTDSEHASHHKSASRCRMSGCSRTAKAGELYCSLHVEYTTEYSDDYTSPAMAALSSDSTHSSLYEKFCDKFGCNVTIHAQEKFCPMHRTLSKPSVNYSKTQQHHHSKDVKDEDVDKAEKLLVSEPVPELITSDDEMLDCNYGDNSLLGVRSGISCMTDEQHVDPFDSMGRNLLGEFASSKPFDMQRSSEISPKAQFLPPAVGGSIQSASRRLFDEVNLAMEVDMQPDEDTKVKPSEILRVWKDPEKTATDGWKDQVVSEIKEFSEEKLKKPPTSVHASDDGWVERNHLTEVSEMPQVEGMLEVAALPRSMPHNFDPVSLVEPTETVFPPPRMDCIGPVCKNYGLEKCNGLCEACYNVLLVANMTKVACEEPNQNQIAALTDAFELLMDGETRCETKEQQATQSECVHEWCHHEATHQDEGLCDICYDSLQIFQASADSKKNN